MLGRLAPLLLVASSLGAGCHTAVGNYFANRGRDLGECVRAELGLGWGFGAGVNAAGFAHVWLYGGSLYPPATVGVTYGQWAHDLPPFWAGYVPEARAGEADAAGLELRTNFEGAPLMSNGIESKHFARLRWEAAHECCWLLPAVLSWVHEIDAPRPTGPPPPGAVLVPITPQCFWLWSSDARRATWARVHAFDVEVGVHPIFFGLRVGLSPGELLDFLLGWVGVDIAGDDRALQLPGADAAASPGHRR